MHVRSTIIGVFTVAATSTIVACGSGVGSGNTATGGGSNSSTMNLSTVGLTATGAGLACSGGQNAYNKFGTAAFVAVVNSIIANVNTELTGPNGTTNLGLSFNGAGSGSLPANQDNLGTFKGSLTAFLVFLYGGPTYINYDVHTTGTTPVPITFAGPQGMQEAHTGFNITSSQYTYFVTQMIVPALTSNGVSSADVSSCFAPPLLDSTFIASIVGQ